MRLHQLKTSRSCLFMLELMVTCLTFLNLKYVHADYILWEHQISGSGKIGDRGLRKGNGVVISSNGSQVWITMDDGTLHILDSTNPKKSAKVVEPPKLVGYFVESRSSVSLFENKNGVQYAVYAVIYSPISENQPTWSRVIALSNAGNILWSEIIGGVAIGTPVIGNNGNLLYITHNVKQRKSDKFARGFLSILRSRDGYVIFNDSADSSAPFGPLALSSRNGKDTLYWGQSWDSGYTLSGRMYQYDSVHERIVHLQRTNWSVDSAPLVSKHGHSLWVGGSQSHIFGWLYRKTFTGDPTYSRQVGPLPRHATTPLPNRAAITPDESKIFVSSGLTSFYCLNARTGRKLWSTDEGENESVYMTEAVVSPDGTKVYSIRHNDGMVRQIDVRTGKVLFQFSCQDLTQSSLCHNSVEAQFSLSSDGSKLYYGDIFGKIVALSVTPEPPSLPNKSPSTSKTQDQLKPPSNEQKQNDSDFFFLPSEPSKPSKPISRPTISPSKVITPSNGRKQSNFQIRDPFYFLFVSLEPSGAPSTTPPTPFPTVFPTSSPTVLSSSNPTMSPSNEPSQIPTTIPSLHISDVPTMLSSINPSNFPTVVSSQNPTDSSNPSLVPSSKPSLHPSGLPTIYSSNEPSSAPTMAPSSNPTESFHPSFMPSVMSSILPSVVPSLEPSNGPSYFPSNEPSSAPTMAPSSNPTESFHPSFVPSVMSSILPSVVPSLEPSNGPSYFPSSNPTQNPSAFYSTSPSKLSSISPTIFSSRHPSVNPSQTPSHLPTLNPSIHASDVPSHVPSQHMSEQPSVHLSHEPTDFPSPDPSNPKSSIPTVIPSMYRTVNPTTPPSMLSSSHPTNVPSLDSTQFSSVIPSSVQSSEPSSTPSLIPSSVQSSEPSSTPSLTPSSLDSITTTLDIDDVSGRKDPFIDNFAEVTTDGNESLSHKNETTSSISTSTSTSLQESSHKKDGIHNTVPNHNTHKNDKTVLKKPMNLLYWILSGSCFAIAFAILTNAWRVHRRNRFMRFYT